jgi:hypothetical protein
MKNYSGLFWSYVPGSFDVWEGIKTEAYSTFPYSEFRRFGDSESPIHAETSRQHEMIIMHCPAPGSVFFERVPCAKAQIRHEYHAIYALFMYINHLFTCFLGKEPFFLCLFIFGSTGPAARAYALHTISHAEPGHLRLHCT